VLLRLLIAVALLLPSTALGHAVGVTKVTATFAEDGTYRVEVAAHPSPLGVAQRVPDVLGEGKGVIVALRPEDGGGGGKSGTAHSVLPDAMLTGIFTRDRPVRFDGVGSDATVELAGTTEDGSRVVVLTGTVPEGAAIFRWHAPKELGIAELRATTPTGPEPALLYIEAGRPSDPVVFAAGRPSGPSHRLVLLAVALLIGAAGAAWVVRSR